VVEAVIDAVKADRLQTIGCLACRKDGVFGVPADLHHPTSGGRRLGDDKVIPLCPWHHRGVTGLAAAILYHHGPSLANGRKPFEARYGTEAELLAETERLLELYA
jgi:hypothetical protein